jgi:hypothetical protein
MQLMLARIVATDAGVDCLQKINFVGRMSMPIAMAAKPDGRQPDGLADSRK